MVKTLLTIRYKQLSNQMNVSGPYILIGFVLIAFLMYWLYSVYQEESHAIYVFSAISLNSIWIQIVRKDKQFIYQHIDKPHLEIYSEYILLSLPFILPALLTKSWFYFPLALIALYLVPYLTYSPKQKTRLKTLSKIIPAGNFEWISGIRKNYVFVLPLYLLSLAFSWFKILPLISLWILTISILSFYNECESLQIINEGNKSAKNFLKPKLINHSKYLLILYTPILVINTVFNYEYWILNLLFIPVQLAVLCFAICLKYANYSPNTNSEMGSLSVVIVAMSAILPFLLPLPLIMAVNYYNKAKENLKYYLND